MKNLVPLSLIIFLLIGGYFLFNFSAGGSKNTNQTQKPEPQTPQPAQSQEINFTAKFSIITNGTKRVFSDAKYHNRSESVYITADDPSTIYVKKRGIIWKDLFDSLPSPMKVENDCLHTGTGQVFCNSNTHSLKFFLNGEKVDQVLGKEIKDGDKLLVSYGPKNEDLEEQLKP